MVIEAPDGINRITGTAATSGITADPYRAELLGIYMLLSAISFVEQHNAGFTNGYKKLVVTMRW